MRQVVRTWTDCTSTLYESKRPASSRQLSFIVVSTCIDPKLRAIVCMCDADFYSRFSKLTGFRKNESQGRAALFSLATMIVSLIRGSNWR
jgi:hypothetical protein